MHHRDHGIGRRRTRRGAHNGKGGFTLVELLVVLAIITLLLALLLPSLRTARQTGSLAVSHSNLHQLGVATGSYAADYGDKLFGFSWQAGETYMMMDAEGEVAPVQMDDSFDVRAASMQAVHIMRSRADRIGEHAMPEMNSWIPQVLYSHLVIQDYLASRLPERMVVDPGDVNRMNWQIDPTEKFDAGYWLPLQPEPIPQYYRWPYSSSYQVVPASYDRYQSDLSEGAASKRICQAGMCYMVPDGQLEPMTLPEVVYPASKVHMHDTHQRHFGDRQPYFGLEEARLPLLFFDGSVSVRRTADANPGWHPNHPEQPCMLFMYTPASWQPPTMSGDDFDIVKGYYRWTRGGLLGIDFGGDPLHTGQQTPGECPL